MAYATYADLELTLDTQIIAQLSTDQGAPMIGANPVTTMALDRASSIIDAYARVGNIYTSSDLAALASANDPMIVMLTVDLAAEILFQRRAMKVTPAVEARLTKAYAILGALRDGKMIFGAVAKAADAGLPEVAATPLQTLAYYNNVSSSAFFRPRLPGTMPGA